MDIEKELMDLASVEMAKVIDREFLKHMEKYSNTWIKINEWLLNEYR